MYPTDRTLVNAAANPRNPIIMTADQHRTKFLRTGYTPQALDKEFLDHIMMVQLVDLTQGIRCKTASNLHNTGIINTCQQSDTSSTNSIAQPPGSRAMPLHFLPDLDIEIFDYSHD